MSTHSKTRNPDPDLDGIVAAAVASGARVLAITDHNTSRFTAAAIKAAEGRDLVHHKDALQLWFTDQDPDPHRLAAWKARQNVSELRA